MTRQFRRLFAATLLALAALMIRPASAGDERPNLIIIIPDGFGPQASVAGRLAKGSNLTLDSMIVGLESTHSTDSPVADSAATATAIATGVNSSNGRIGVDADGLPLATIMEAAAKKGYVTGLVATSRITHATPASFAAHVPARSMENEIALQLVDSKVDFMLGGGESRFHASGHQFPTGDTPAASVDALERASELGISILKTKKQLLEADPTAEGRTLGVFASSHVAYAIDREEGDDNVGLLDMTKFALSYAEAHGKDRGFCLMIEASRIDHAAHGNDLAAFIEEILDFDETVTYIRDFAERIGNTQIVITADHDCGGFTVGANGIYDFDVETARKVIASAEVIGRAIAPDSSNVDEVLAKYVGYELTEAEMEEIHNAPEGRYEPGSTIGKVLSRRAFAGWTSSGHTGADVTRYAYGPISDQLTGLLHHAETGRIMQDYLGLRETVDAMTAELQAAAAAAAAAE